MKQFKVQFSIKLKPKDTNHFELTTWNEWFKNMQLSEINRNTGELKFNAILRSLCEDEPCDCDIEWKRIRNVLKHTSGSTR